jgi:hypothetical protein
VAFWRKKNRPCVASFLNYQRKRRAFFSHEVPTSEMDCHWPWRHYYCPSRGEATMNALRVAVLICSFAGAASFAQETNSLPTTITVAGVTYSNVVFGRVSPAWVSIRHSTGAASIPLEKLPPELQKRFGYDPNKAADYRAQELAAAQRRKAEAQANERLRQEREAAALEAARKERESQQKLAKEELEANQKFAARVEVIQVLCIASPVSVLPTGRYVAQVTLTNQNAVCAYFDDGGKRYLESASQKYAEWKTRHDLIKQANEAAAAPQVDTETVERRRVVYLETPQPWSGIFGVREENSCYSLLGVQQITDKNGLKSWSW